MYRLLQLFYLMLPIYLANMAPPFVKFWHGWNRPISERHLGSHKTVLGFVSGTVMAMIAVYVQSRVRWSGSLISYDHWAVVGAIAGCGAMAGDSVKSYFKRRMNIAPGRSWIPWDQFDFILGGLLALLPWIRLNAVDLAWILGFSFFADIAVNHIAYYFGIRDTKW